MGSAEDYPYDPDVEERIHELRGLEKLRAIRDRRTAQWLYEIWGHILANESRIERSYEGERRRREREEYERLKSLRDTVRDGVYGPTARELGKEITQDWRDDSLGCLEHLAAELRRGGFTRTRYH